MASAMKPVLCVGCTVIDFVTISASFPKEDTDERCLDGNWQRGGNASNVCTVLRLLGLKVDFFGVLSKSDGFRVLLDDLQRRQIGVQHCPMSEKDPPFSSVIIAQDTGSRTIVHCNKNYPYVTWEDFRKIDLNEYGWVHFEARHPKETIKMIETVRQHNALHDTNIKISLDFETLYEKNLKLCLSCDYVVFSKDLASRQGWETACSACSHLVSALTPSSVNIICPWGKEGASCVDSFHNYSDVPAHEPDSVVDTLGAGDSFMAGFIYATYVSQKNLPDAVDFANRVAGHKISDYGYDHIAQIQKDQV
ncbi:ketohexokinase [Drosophila nasuta]|uniref:ketohexokinase n=1 Tax=Drosophila nasuta TaxID=42062 RepID=UPI00295E50F0|nr:ketohexokinase [Drosophila nasuta]XP_060655480.1 ketohexokinase [Drosophila nasuta]XP_060655481.1 ketohexokinase [Drosophila nasuta]